VVRLHSGDPSLYGAIVEQMQMLCAEGVSCEIVPGVSSIFAAAAALGPSSLSGSLGYPHRHPSRGKTLESDEIEALSRHKATLAFFLGADRIEEIVEKLRCPLTRGQRSSTMQLAR